MKKVTCRNGNEDPERSVTSPRSYRRTVGERWNVNLGLCDYKAQDLPSAS